MNTNKGSFAFAFVAHNVNSEDVGVGDKEGVHKNFVIVGDSFVDVNRYLSAGKVLIFVDAFPGMEDDGPCNIIALFARGTDSFLYESKVGFLNK